MQAFDTKAPGNGRICAYAGRVHPAAFRMDDSGHLPRHLRRILRPARPSRPRHRHHGGGGRAHSGRRASSCASSHRRYRRRRARRCRFLLARPLLRPCRCKHMAPCAVSRNHVARLCLFPSPWRQEHFHRPFFRPRPRRHPADRGHHGNARRTLLAGQYRLRADLGARPSCAGGDCRSAHRADRRQEAVDTFPHSRCHRGSGLSCLADPQALPSRKSGE